MCGKYTTFAADFEIDLHAIAGNRQRQPTSDVGTIDKARIVSAVRNKRRKDQSSKIGRYKQNNIINRESFETCAHRNGRSIKAKHKTFAR